MRPFFFDAILQHRPWAERLFRESAEYLSRSRARSMRVQSITHLEDNFLKERYSEYFVRSLHLPREWLSLIGSPQFDTVLEEAIQSAKELQVAEQTLLCEYFASVNFELSGRKVFYFDGKLVDKLLVTVADAPSELLRLPFPSCFLVLEYPPLLQLFGRATKANEVNGETPLSVSVTETEQADGRHLTFFLSRMDHRNFAHSACVKRSWLVGQGRTVEEALSTEWAPASTAADEDERFFRDDFAVLFRCLANGLLYLSSRSADIVFRESPLFAELVRLKGAVGRGRQVAKSKARLQRSEYSRLSYVHVGGSIPVTPFRPFFHTANFKELRRIHLARSLVRGHWRLQPHGKASTLRKLIFIEPYWRGPDFGEKVSKAYEVKV